MQAAVPLRGLLPPLAALAATVLSASVPVAALAAPADDPVHPRTTTVNRTEGLDPEGDTVTVSGIGHSPGSRIEITTRAVPASAAESEEPEEAAVLDTENTVLVEVDERGLFTADLDTGVDFAADAGLEVNDVILSVQGETVSNADASTAAGAADLLPSWNEGRARSAVLRFVSDVTTNGGTMFVPPAERVWERIDAVAGKKPVNMPDHGVPWMPVVEDDRGPAGAREHESRGEAGWTAADDGDVMVEHHSNGSRRVKARPAVGCRSSTKGCWCRNRSGQGRMLTGFPCFDSQSSRL